MTYPKYDRKVPKTSVGTDPLPDVSKQRSFTVIITKSVVVWADDEVDAVKTARMKMDGETGYPGQVSGLVRTDEVRCINNELGKQS